MSELVAVRGRKREWDVTVTRPTTPVQAVNLTGATLWFTVKYSPTDSDSDAVIRKVSSSGGGIAIVSAAAGTATITLEPVDTQGITLAQTIRGHFLGPMMHWELTVLEADGSLWAVDQGNFVIESSVLGTYDGAAHISPDPAKILVGGLATV